MISDFAVRAGTRLSGLWPDLPLPVWMILVALLMGLLSGRSSGEIIGVFNGGFGYAIGEFALILIPSLVLAAAIEQQRLTGSPRLTVGLAPALGAGMICPDTAYAALSPMARRNRLSVAFGAYAGFKLLFPAGPLIIATSLGVADSRLLIYCILIFLPVWAVGLIYGRAFDTRLSRDRVAVDRSSVSIRSLVTLWPLAVLAALLALGLAVDMSVNPWLDFATNPKGALLITAAAALSMTQASERRACIDSGLRRTATLLLVIGAASAFSAFLVHIVPIDRVFGAKQGFLALIALFLMTAVFKLLQGSSMSTFAAVGPVALPVVTASELSPFLGVIAICLGSFVAILPNDSFYWLIRKSALTEKSELGATAILAAGATLQAIVGFAVLMGFYLLHAA